MNAELQLARLLRQQNSDYEIVIADPKVAAAWRNAHMPFTVEAPCQ